MIIYIIAAILIIGTVILYLRNKQKRNCYVMVPIVSSLLTKFLPEACVNSKNHILRLSSLHGDRISGDELLGIVEINRPISITLPKNTNDRYVQLDIYSVTGNPSQDNINLVYSIYNFKQASITSKSKKNCIVLPPGRYWPIIRLSGEMDREMKRFIKEIKISSTIKGNVDVDSHINMITDENNIDVRQGAIVPITPYVKQYIYEFRCKSNDIKIGNTRSICDSTKASNVIIFDSCGNKVKHTKENELVYVVETVYGSYTANNYEKLVIE